MKRISQLRDKSFKRLKFWNYRTILMFLFISIIIFLLLLLVSGCKVDAAEHINRKPITTQTTQKIAWFVPVQTAAEVNINRMNSNESDSDFIKVVSDSGIIL